MHEQGVIFNCEGRQLIGIEHRGACGEQPNENRHKGVVIVVGGPQTRVGSHRLFVYLARQLAKQGINVFRFDYTGAGDSEGEVVSFQTIQADIAAAIDTFKQRNQHVTELTLWGLCDAASAILLYLHQFPNHAQIQQLFLVNPWVKQEHSRAVTFLRYYYIRRLFTRQFWQKLLSGKVNLKASLRQIKVFKQQSSLAYISQDDEHFISKMHSGLASFSGICYFVLSNNDLTAKEFVLLTRKDKNWQAIMLQEHIIQENIAEANHTFANIDKKQQLTNYVLHKILDFDTKKTKVNTALKIN